MSNQLKVFIIQILWTVCGILGMRIYRKAEPEFYAKFNPFILLYVQFIYIILGPAVLIMSLIHIVVKKKLPS
jgi:hypothetical protein